jgi:uncharacterized membrane protein YoaK (UPF0700 family)
MIHLQEVSEIYNKRSIVLWLISAFKSGFINSAGFLIAGKFVSHITGFGTQAGLAIGHDDYFFGAELLLIPTFFIAGGVLTSWILDRDYEKHQRPPYHLVQALVTILIGLVIYIGGSKMNDGFVKFDSDLRFDFVEFAIISLLCLICGLKNSLVTWTTYGKIRVTHLTGTATDLGLNLIRSFTGRQPAPRFRELRIVNLTRVMTLASFSLGAFLSAIVFPRLGFVSFSIVFVISLGLTIYSFYEGLNSETMASETKANHLASRTT